MGKRVLQGVGCFAEEKERTPDLHIDGTVEVEPEPYLDGLIFQTGLVDGCATLWATAFE